MGDRGIGRVDRDIKTCIELRFQWPAGLGTRERVKYNERELSKPKENGKMGSRNVQRTTAVQCSRGQE